MIKKSTTPYWLASLAVGILLLAYRLIVLKMTAPGLFFDEAYYYGWSLTPDWGYYSKPPVVAWLIWLSTHLFGVSEFTVKLPASLIYFVTALVVQKTTTDIHSAKAGFWAFAIFILMPFVSLNSWFITTDAPLLLCWALTTHFYLRAEKTDAWQHWFFAGLFGGLGLLSKYTMILLPVSLFVMYLATKQYQRLLHGKFWLTIATAFIVFSPNIIWQFQNGFPSFIHTAELANKSDWDGNPQEFLPAQIVIFGPIAIYLLLATLGKSFRQRYSALWYITWVPLIFFSLKSIQGEAFINWVAFAYASGAILAGIVLAAKKPSLKWAHLGVSLMLAMLLYHYPMIQHALGIEPTKKNTLYARIEGWREIMLRVKDITEQYPDYYIGSGNRAINSYLNFYIPNAKNRLRSTNWDHHISDQYELFYPLKASDRPIIWLSDKKLGRISFAEGNADKYLVEKLVQQVYPSYQRTLWVYKVE